MSPGDSKHMLAIIICAIITPLAETCPENHYQLPGIPTPVCCPMCPSGYFVVSNCTRAAGGPLIGVGCKKCRKCEDAGFRNLVQCSLFTDTQCGAGPSVSAAPQHTHNAPHRAGVQLSMSCCWLLLSVLLLALIAAAAACVRLPASGDTDRSSADSLHVEDVESM